MGTPFAFVLPGLEKEACFAEWGRIGGDFGGEVVCNAVVEINGYFGVEVGFFHERYFKARKKVVVIKVDRKHVENGADVAQCVHVAVEVDIGIKESMRPRLVCSNGFYL